MATRLLLRQRTQPHGGRGVYIYIYIWGGIIKNGRQCNKSPLWVSRLRSSVELVNHACDIFSTVHLIFFFSRVTIRTRYNESCGRIRYRNITHTHTHMHIRIIGDRLLGNQEMQFIMQTILVCAYILFFLYGHSLIFLTISCVSLPTCSTFSCILSMLVIPSIIIHSLELFTSALADGFSLESEWQQVSSSLQDSS